MEVKEEKKWKLNRSVLRGRSKADRSGLLPGPDRIVEDAAAGGGVARLVAECVRLPSGVSACVEPMIVAPDSAFARLAAEENLVELETGSSGTLHLSGPGAGAGAGGTPTASAVLSDMLRATPATAAAGPDAPMSAPDTRQHCWMMTIRAGQTARQKLRRAADRARVGIDDRYVQSERGTIRTITSPLTRARADLLIRSLEAAGLEARFVRYEAKPQFYSETPTGLGEDELQIIFRTSSPARRLDADCTSTATDSLRSFHGDSTVTVRRALRLGGSRRPWVQLCA